MTFQREIPFSQIVDFDRLDDRVCIVNVAFANLVGVNEGFIELCSEQDPPTRAELIAWSWLINPATNRPRKDQGANPYFVDLIETRYEGNPPPG